MDIVSSRVGSLQKGELSVKDLFFRVLELKELFNLLQGNFSQVGSFFADHQTAYLSERALKNVKILDSIRSYRFLDYLLPYVFQILPSCVQSYMFGISSADIEKFSTQVVEMVMEIDKYPKSEEFHYLHPSLPAYIKEFPIMEKVRKIMRDDLLSLPCSSSIDWRWFVSPLKGDLSYGEEDQFYGTVCACAVQKMLRVLEEEGNPTLRIILKIASYARRKIAFITDTYRYVLFGLQRIQSSSTMEEENSTPFLFAGYTEEIFQERIQKIVTAEGKEVTNRQDLPPFLPKFAFEKDDNIEKASIFKIGSDTSPVYVYLIGERIIAYVACLLIGKDIYLINRIYFPKCKKYLDFEENPIYLWNILHSIEVEGKLVSHFIHCPTRNVSKVMEVAEKAFSEIVNTDSSNKSSTLKEIATIHWILNNCMPFSRGSAAICDTVIIALLLLYKFPLSPYREGVRGDLEALTWPLDEFIQRYPDFRQKSLL